MMKTASSISMASSAYSATPQDVWYFFKNFHMRDAAEHEWDAFDMLSGCILFYHTTCVAYDENTSQRDLYCCGCKGIT